MPHTPSPSDDGVPVFAPRHTRRGMSLLEVMVTIAIILTLMGVLAYGVISTFVVAQERTTELTLGKVAERLEIHMMRKRTPPSTAEGLARVYGHEPLPTDSWGAPLRYVSPGPDGTPFDLMSVGEDGQEGTDDDILWSQRQ